MPPTLSSPAASSPTHHETPDKDRVPWREKLGLGLGALASAGSWGTIHVMVIPVFTMYLGVNPALLTSILFIVRIWDAFIDPVIGQYSDNFRSRWGRRKPMIALGAPLMSFLFVAMWWFPTGASPNTIAFAFLIAYLLYASAFTIYSMPLSGLTIEATNDYHERTRIAALVSVFGFAFQIGSQFFLRAANNTDWFPNMISGVHWITGVTAIVVFCSAMAPIFLCRERNYALVTRQPSLPLLPSLKAALTSAPFHILLITRLLVSFCYNTVSQLAMLMCVYYVFAGDKTAGIATFVWIGSTFHIAAIVGSLMIYPALSRRFGKRATMQFAAGALIVGCSCKIFLYIPGEPWWQLIIIGCNGLALSGMGLIASSMLGDIADYDELKHGTRREALFSSLVTWADKAGSSVGTLVSGFLVWIWGYNATTREFSPYILGAQSPYTLELMRWGYVLMPMLGAVAAIMLIRRYAISEEDAYATKDELKRRHTEQHLPIEGAPGAAQRQVEASAPISRPARPARGLLKAGGVLLALAAGLAVAMDYCGVMRLGIFKTIADLPPAERKLTTDTEIAKLEAELARQRTHLHSWLIMLYGHVPTPRETIPEPSVWKAPCAKLDLMAAEAALAAAPESAELRAARDRLRDRARTIDESLSTDLAAEGDLIIRLKKAQITGLEAEAELRPDNDAKARLAAARQDLEHTIVELKATAEKRASDKKAQAAKAASGSGSQAGKG